MKLLSWDVGFRNLAYCLMEKNGDNINIIKWDIVDLIEDSIPVYPTCQGTCKNGNSCNKKASIIQDDNHYCKLHYDKNKDFQEYGVKKICQQMVGSKKNLRHCKRKIFYKSGENYYCKIHGKKYNGLIIKKDLNYYELCQVMLKKLENINNIFDVDEVIIENQPTLRNPKMKTIQVMLFSFFVMRDTLGRIKHVSYISASNKLKEAKLKYNLQDDDHKKKKYNHRKKLSILYTKELLKNDPEQLEHLSKYKKKDDLCDAFLQGIHYLRLNK